MRIEDSVRLIKFDNSQDRIIQHSSSNLNSFRMVLETVFEKHGALLISFPREVSSMSQQVDNR